MKFSIRDLLLVTIIVALVLGWWLDRSRLNKERKASEVWAQYAAGELENFGYKVEWIGGADDPRAIFHIAEPTGKYIPNPHWHEPVTWSSIHGHSRVPPHSSTSTPNPPNP